MKHIIVDLATGTTSEQNFTADEIAEATEQAWKSLRSERNRLLAACDWTVATDSPVDVSAWIVYRQALRDLPANTNDPTAVVWPTPPA